MAFPTCQNESQFTTGGGVGRGSLQTHWEKVLRLSHKIGRGRMRLREARFSSEMDFVCGVFVGKMLLVFNCSLSMTIDSPKNSVKGGCIERCANCGIYMSFSGGTW